MGKIRIVVELDPSTRNGWNAYDLIREACKEYRAPMKAYREAGRVRPLPSDNANIPPSGYPVAWPSCAAMVHALCVKFNRGIVPGGWNAKFRRGVANASRPSASLRSIIEPLGLIQPDGYALVWWRVSRDFAPLPPPEG